MPKNYHNDRGLGQRPNLVVLSERARLLRELRAFFDRRGFLEVQPPCLSQGCIVDAFIDPIEVDATQFRLGIDLAPRFYLQTSPELSMKRMLAAGAPSIYSLGPVFRAGERGDHHNPEFTMLEWYDVGADFDAGVQLLGTLAAETLQRDGFDVVSYRELFHKTLGFDPIESEMETLRSHLQQLDPGLVESLGSDRDGMLDALLSERIQPTLGLDRPLIVTNYPLSQAALAKPSPEDPCCASRFELFAAGVELANGYDELRDREILSARFRETDRRRVEFGRRPLGQASEAFEQTISDALPQCTGVALGVDRLLMVRLGAKKFSDVAPFTIELA